MGNNNTRWLAAYLYYNEPWERFLTHAVKPFTEKVLKEDLAEQFFFIRYWEKGPHIRLRFKGNSQLLDEQLKPQLISHFEAYYRENPSVREDSEQIKSLPIENQWYPNNSIQFIDYEPEVDRYGGEVCITIAEEQFEASSKAILSILAESDDWDYSRALGAAIQLHLGFAYAFEMDIQEACGFFERLFENWLSRAYYSYNQDISREEIEQRKEETLNAFKENFDNQEETLRPFFETVWKAFQDKQEFEQAWLNNWLDDMQVIKQRLTEVQDNEQLFPPDWYRLDDKSQIPLTNQRRWAIYDSYIHMINNRLGILNRDESYLGYLIKEVLKSLK